MSDEIEIYTERCAEINRQPFTQIQRWRYWKKLSLSLSFTHTKSKREMWKVTEMQKQRHRKVGGGISDLEECWTQRKNIRHVFVHGYHEWTEISANETSQPIREPSESFLMTGNKGAWSVVYFDVAFELEHFVIKFLALQLQFPRQTVLYSVSYRGTSSCLLFLYTSRDRVFILLIWLTQSVMGKHFKLLLVIQRL